MKKWISMLLTMNKKTYSKPLTRLSLKATFGFPSVTFALYSFSNLWKEKSEFINSIMKKSY